MEKPKNSIDLFEFSNSFGAIKEEPTKTIFRQVHRHTLSRIPSYLIKLTKLCFKIVEHCIFLRDKCGVFHRDLKDENILINPANLKIRVIDFGCATEFDPNKTYETVSGTPEFFSPEVYTRRKYKAEKLTTWSLGILLYVLLFGDLPFDTESQIIKSKRIKVEIHFNLNKLI